MCESQMLCEQLAREFPEVGDLLEAHLADNGELLPHVFFGDLTRYVLSDGRDKAAVVQRLEDVLSGADSAVEELIGVSFVENLETREELEHVLKGVTGNRIREEWHRQHAV
jgi:hypothetical protein